MAVYNVHGGHSLVCRGAAGLLDEVIEDRKVKNRVIKKLFTLSSKLSWTTPQE